MTTPQNPGAALWRTATLRRVEQAHAQDNLMERAGAAAAAWAEALSASRPGGILILAGPGNNGGDAFVTARLLHQRGMDVTLVFPGGEATAARLPPDAAHACRQFVDAGSVWCTDIPPQTDWRLIIDGFFGIGITRALEGAYAALVAHANALSRRQDCPLLALDCPSGLNAETGAALGEAVIHATHTLTFMGAKAGLYTADGPDCCGTIRIADLDLDMTAEAAPDGRLVALSEFAACLKPRLRNSHKGTFGSVALLGGASGMIGALLLAGRAALKSGAGRVFLGFLAADAPMVDPLQPELMLRPPRDLFEIQPNALACGPGMGQEKEAAELLGRALEQDAPLVLDADALTLLARDAGLAARLPTRRAPTLLTPHPAEAARLLQTDTASIQQNRIDRALELAERSRAWVVLKGCGSVIAAPDGQWRINPFGNPGLATAGSGDVLTGIVVALLGQGCPPFEALQAACALHGMAAEQLAANGVGPIGLAAGELIDAARAIRNQINASAMDREGVPPLPKGG